MRSSHRQELNELSRRKHRRACGRLALLLANDLAAAQGGSAEATGESRIFSEMQSPLDYAPVSIAGAWSAADADGRAMQLSIQCRRGRTDSSVGCSPY